MAGWPFQTMLAISKVTISFVHTEKCSVKNGECQHTCDIDGTGNVVCECREGYRLGEDGKSCDGMYIHVSLI